MMRKYYFINKFDTKNIDKQEINTGIIYRNYDSKNNLKTIIKLKKYCKKKGYKFYLSNDVKLANSLDLNGAYIPSFNKNTTHLSYSYKKNFLIIGSAHNNNQIKSKSYRE
jgi:thiamine-phosphate pyrophosphorylase